MNSGIDKLLEIGFKKVGSWNIIKGEIQHNISTHLDQKNILYAFVSNREIKYIGKTIRSFKRRMYNYHRPGKSMRTSIRINKKIIDTLTS